MGTPQENNAFRSPEDYELFIYTLQEQYPAILHSTLVFARRGATLARLSGSITFPNNIRLEIVERLVFDRLPLRIDGYGYEIWHEQEKLYWYDSQPHPNEPSLQSTHPHHKHIPPNIKQNRIPAPNLSFTKPNLPFLITEILQLPEFS